MNVLRCAFLILLFSFTHASGQESLNNAAFGKVFTPKGDLRILIIYAGFDGFDKNQGYHNWGYGNDMPVYDPKELFFNDFKSFQPSSIDSFPNNLSSFYYQFSNTENPFRIVADVLPKRINIDPSSARSFSDCNRLVIEKMMYEFPDFDWKPYDGRKNLPRYKFDNSFSEPDKKPDYVIIAYRYAPGWSKQPKAGMQNWAANYSRLDGLHNINFNGFSFDGAGFTLAGFEGKTSQFKGLFIHELAHELYSCPHYSGTNNALGNYFHLPTIGWDMMNLLGGFSCNAFERWLLGWKEIKHDLKDVTHNGTYVLNDYITSGDVIRIKIPHTENQYLWIENHQKKSSLDEKLWKGALLDQPKGSRGIPPKEPGIYMYIESVLDDRSKISEGMVYDLNKVNGILPLHAGGNYDYEKPVRFSVSPDEYWNNKLFWFKKGSANPLSGINPFINFRHDMDSNGVINQIAGSFGEFNGLRDCECFPIVKEIISGKPILTYANLAGRIETVIAERRSDAFQENDILNISSNPMIINRPVYHKKDDSLSPFFLNGISVEIVGIEKGVASLKIDFDNTTLDNNVRWCGNIICKPLNSINEYDLLIAQKRSMILDLSATPNKLKMPFVNHSIFTIDSGAVVFLSKEASIIVKEGSTLKIKNGGKVIMDKDASLKIDRDSFLEIEEGGEITFLNKGSVIYLNQESLKINSKSKVIQNGYFKKKNRI